MKQKLNHLTEQDLEGKFVVACDSVCDGLTVSVQDDNDLPVLFDSKYDALLEIFDSVETRVLQYLSGDDEDFLEESGLTHKLVDVIRSISEIEGDNHSKSIIVEYLFKDHPEANIYEESVEDASTFVNNRKLMFGSDGASVTGEPLLQYINRKIDEYNSTI
jgi:hypothetical protein